MCQVGAENGHDLFSSDNTNDGDIAPGTSYL